MASMGGVAGLGIGMPQGGGIGSSPSESRLTFDEGLLRTLCDLDVSAFPAERLPSMSLMRRPSWNPVRIATHHRENQAIYDELPRRSMHILKLDCMTYFQLDQQIAAFFRSRAELEDKYARGMNELVRGSADSYSRAFCKAGYVYV